MIQDGDYDALVVDAADVDADDGEIGRAVLLSLTFISGPRKGDVVEVRAVGLGRDSLDLLAAPCTLVVRNGVPSVVLD